MILILFFFAALFAASSGAREWGEADSNTLFFVALGLVAAGGLMLISAVFIVTFARSINSSDPATRVGLTATRDFNC